MMEWLSSVSCSVDSSTRAEGLVGLCWLRGHFDEQLKPCRGDKKAPQILQGPPQVQCCQAGAPSLQEERGALPRPASCVIQHNSEVLDPL